MKSFDSVLVKSAPAKILCAAATEKVQTVSEISIQVRSPKSYVGEILSDLEEEGFVESSKSEDDARKKLYSVTEQGQAFLNVLDKA